MTSFFDATALRESPAALRRRFQDDGYVFLPGLLEVEPLLRLRREILEICEQANWLKPGGDPMEAIVWTAPKVEGEEAYFEVYDRVQRLESLHRLAHEAGILTVMQHLLDGAVFPHPLSICRLAFPFDSDWVTPPHQDYPNNQGTEDLYACWIPLGDCPADRGALRVLAGSHRLGLLPLAYALGAGHRRSVLDRRSDDLEWVSGDFRVGDVLIFHSLTVHASNQNTSERLRVSVDYRYQREGEPLTAECLLPHFGRQTWEDIYRHWSSDSLKYYWRSRRCTIVPWNPRLHELPADHVPEALRLKSAYDRNREKLAARFRR